MAVKIRLRRTGGRNDICYRVVAADTRSPRDGRFIESLGWYDPKIEGINFKLNIDGIRAWKSKGAILSETVRSLVQRCEAAGLDQPAEVAVAEAEPPDAVAEAAVEEPSAATEEAESVDSDG